MCTTDSSKRAAMIALSGARHTAYGFLSSAFSAPPSADLLAAVRDHSFLRAAAVLFGEGGFGELRDCFQAGKAMDDLLRAAREEFMLLWKAPGSQYIPAYESVFHGTREVEGKRVRGLLMGAAAVDAQKWYRLAALEISPACKELPDHISMELNYLAHLCAKERQFASEGGQEKLTRAWVMQRDFLATHVTPWVGALRNEVYEKSTDAFFRAVADMTCELTRRDLATLEDLLGPFQPTPQAKDPTVLNR